MAEYNLGTAHGTVKIDSDTAGVDQASQSLDGLTRKGESTSQALGTIGNTMGVAGLAIAGGLGVAVKTAADFEAELSGIQAVSGATTAQMDKVHDAALRIGKDTTFSASEAAQAMQELVKAGIPVEDVLNGAADATVALAAATGVDMPTAASIASNAMNVFGIQADDMDRVVNTFAQTANASAIDITDLGMAMSQVGAVADLAGLSMEDTTKAIGQLGDAGIKGSDAGTSLKTMLMNLQPSTEAAANTFRELGIITADGTNQFYNANGELKSLREVQEILRTSTQGMTDAQKQMALETMFGSDAIRAAAVLAEGGAEAYDNFGTKMAGSGTAAEQAKIRQDNMKGSLEQLKGSLETAGIIIGEQLIPPLTTVVEKVGQAVDWFGNLSSGTQKLITYIALGAAGFLLMGSAIIKTVSFFSQMSSAVSTVIGALTRKNAAEAASSASSARSAAASAAAAARMAAAWVAASARAVAAWVVMAARSVAQAAIIAGAWLLSTGAAIATSLASMAVAVATTVAGWLAMAAQAVISALIIAAQWLIAFWPIVLVVALIVGLAALIIIFWDQIVAAFQAAIAWIGGLMTTLWNGIQSAWNGIMAVFQWAWDTVVSIFTAIFNFYVSIWSAIINAFITAGQAVWNALQQTFNWIQSVWNSAIAFIRQIPGWIMNVFAGALGWLLGAGQNILNGLWNGIRNVWNSVTGWLGQIGGWIKSAFSGAASWLISAGGDIIRGLWNGISNVKGWILSKISGFVSGILGGIKSFFGIGSPSKETAWMGEMLVQGLAVGVEDEAKVAADAAISAAQLTMNAMEKELAGADLATAVSASLTPGSVAGLKGDGPTLAGTLDSMATSSRPALASSNQAATDAEFQRIVKMEFNTYNPVAERASDNEARKIRAAAAVGAF